MIWNTIPRNNHSNNLDHAYITTNHSSGKCGKIKTQIILINMFTNNRDSDIVLWNTTGLFLTIQNKRKEKTKQINVYNIFKDENLGQNF
jgi:hypothetical protein